MALECSESVHDDNDAYVRRYDATKPQKKVFNKRFYRFPVVPYHLYLCVGHQRSSPTFPFRASSPNPELVDVFSAFSVNFLLPFIFPDRLISPSC